ncbi:MAG: mechanosensitive ion channel family protein [Acidimicrobiales bacterium]
MFADLASACGDRPGLLCEAVYDWTSSERAAKAVEWLLDRPLRILFIVIVATIVSRIVARSITRFVDGLVRTAPEVADDEEVSCFGRSVDRLRYLGDRQARARQRAVTLGAVLRSVARAAIWFVAALLVLGELSINLAPLIAGAGIAGVAIGFGAQSLVRDFLAGIFIIIEDQYGVGDIVDVGEASGVIEEVTLRTTRLRDAAGVLWVVPNGEIRRVGNSSQLWSKSLLDIEVAYDTDVDHATNVIKGVLDELWHEHLPDATIIEEPTVLGLESFGADAIVLRAVVKTEPSEQFAVARVIRARLKKAFDAEGIEIPFPQRTVWLKNENDPNEPSAPPGD